MQKKEAYYKYLLSGFIDNKITLEEVEELLEFIQQEPAWYNRLLNSPEIKEQFLKQAYNINIDISEALSSRMHSHPAT